MPLSKKRDKERKRLEKQTRLENEQFQPKPIKLYMAGVEMGMPMPGADIRYGVIESTGEKVELDAEGSVIYKEG